MTIEEMAYKLCPKDTPDNPAFPNFTDADIWVNGFIEAYPQWISVEKSLPENGQFVILSRDLIDYRQNYTTHFSDEDERFLKLNNVTHWLDLSAIGNPPL